MGRLGPGTAALEGAGVEGVENAAETLAEVVSGDPAVGACEGVG